MTLVYDENGKIVDDPNFAWVDNNVEPLKLTVYKNPPQWVDPSPTPLVNPDASPADIAAYRLAKSVKHDSRLPVEETIIPKQPKRPSYVMEPDLQEAQGGMHLPPGLMQEDSGRFYYQDDPTKTIPMVRRPGLLPIANTPDGLVPVMPKLLDVASNVMGNVAGGKVAAKAGEMVLGSGMVKPTIEAKYPLASAAERHSNALNDNLMQLMTPDEFLNKSRPLKIDEVSRENIDILKQHIKEGKPLDPLELHPNGKEDGRHRAIAAKELGIKEIPVINFRKETVPTFYSTLERAVANAKPNTGTAEQWLGYLRNQPGVKSEELATVLGELPQGKQITKVELEGLVQQNKVELKEKVLGQAEKLNVVPLEEEPHILQIYRSDDPTGERSGMVGEIIKQQKGGREVFKTNVPDIESRFFETQQEAENYISKSTDFGAKTKYHQYQLPGGENYKEMLLSLPEKPGARQHTAEKQALEEHGYVKEDLPTLPDDEYKEVQNRIKELLKEKPDPIFTSGHFDEHGTNLLAHIRMNDRTIEGKKSLHIEEIQSDWGQKIRREGYKLEPKEKQLLDQNAENVDNKLLKAHNGEYMMGHPDLKEGLKMAVNEKVITQKEADDYIKLVANERSTVPNMPFKKTWDELALKRAIRHASENGYDAISWTPGEAQALRYPDELRKKVSKIEWINSETIKGEKQIVIHPTEGGEKMSMRIDKNGIINQGPAQAKGKKLEEVIGKNMANDILNKAEGNIDAKDFVMGAEGMKGFYDKMLVDKANAIGKKHGTKVEQRTIPSEPHVSSIEEYARRLGLPVESETVQREYPKSLKRASQPIHYMPLTPELKAKAMQEGFPLFSSSPVTIPVDHDPFKDDRKNIKLVPVSKPPEF